MKYIPTETLRTADLPKRNDPWHPIEEFALTFSGYDWAGTFEKCADMANATRFSYDGSHDRRLPNLTLDELCACLYFEQRRARHGDYEPEGEDLRYIRALLEAIRGELILRGAGGNA